MKSVRAVERALDLIFAFQARPVQSAADFQRALRPLSRGTIYRLLATLEEAGAIRSFGEPRKYELGSKFAQLAIAWLNNLDPVRIASPFLEELREASGETTSLTLLRDTDDRITAYQLRGNQSTVVAPKIGTASPLFHGATGKVLMANLPEPRLERVLRCHPGRSNDLRHQLQHIRVEGYYVSHGENFAGAVSIAAPVFNANCSVAGAISVATAQESMSATREKTFVKWVRETAYGISRQLGAS